MGKNTRTGSKAAAWQSLVSYLSESVPHVVSWWDDTDSFREIRIKVMPDGTTLAIGKGYGPDGGETVCFGVGYGVAAAILAIDSTIQGGNWRLDKPWTKDGG